MQQKSSFEIKEIAALVNRLMNHYWTADEPATLRQAQAEDWLEDLIEFPPSLVAEACRQWRRKLGSRRPLPGDIRALCIAERREKREQAQVRALASPDTMDEYARSVGWQNNAERMQAIQRDERRRAEQYERARLVREDIAAGVGPLRTAASASANVLRENGVTAREYTSREYTAAELRAGRVALGLEPADAAE